MSIDILHMITVDVKKTVHAPVVIVAAQFVVPSPLDIPRREISAEILLRLLEQKVAQDRADHGVGRFRLL